MPSDSYQILIFATGISWDNNLLATTGLARDATFITFIYHGVKHPHEDMHLTNDDARSCS